MLKPDALYYTQPPVLAFQALVVEQHHRDGVWQVILDKTAFYPEGGGQPSDRGTLNGIPVLDVQLVEGQVVHTLAQPLEVSSVVQGQVDGDFRLEMSQQHTGEHILSGLLCQMFGAQNLGFHIGKDYLTMDTSIPLTPQQLEQAEQAANRVIWENHPVERLWYDRQQDCTLEYRSKKELHGPVCLIRIGTADCCACCGTHLAYTGQVGMIHILDWQNYKQGTRLFVVCGVRALQAVVQMRQQTSAIRQLLSAKPEGLAVAVEQKCQELEDARQRNAQLEQQLFAALAERHDPTLPAVEIQLGLSGPSAQRLASVLAQHSQQWAAVLVPDPGQTRCGYVLATTQADRDLRPICKAINQQFSGKGGGKPGLVQGSVQASAQELQDCLYHLMPL